MVPEGDLSVIFSVDYAETQTACIAAEDWNAGRFVDPSYSTVIMLGDRNYDFSGAPFVPSIETAFRERAQRLHRKRLSRDLSG